MPPVLHNALIVAFMAIIIVGALLALIQSLPKTPDNTMMTLCVGAQACSDLERNMVMHGYKKMIDSK